MVVYSSDEPHSGYSWTDRDLWGYRLSTGEEFAICGKAYYPQDDPTVYYDPAYGELAVWKNWHDLECQFIPAGTNVAIDSANSYAPSVSGDIIAYQRWDSSHSDYDIYGYRISTGEHFGICTYDGAGPYYDRQKTPSISGNIVVWQDDRNDNLGDIYGKDLVSGEEFIVCDYPGSQSTPIVYGDLVVWADLRNGNYDIYGKYLSGGDEFPVCAASGGQWKPDLHGNIVVWEDLRNGNGDIYGAIVIPEPGTLTLLAICGLTLLGLGARRRKR